jgi:hypothetical protein
VLLVGINDRREVVGIGDDVESKLKFARDVLAERLEYPRQMVVFHQVMVPNSNGTSVPCLVVASARTYEAVGVGDGAGHFTYPVRRETGISRPSRPDVASEKTQYKSDSYEFLDSLLQFVKENPPR